MGRKQALGRKRREAKAVTAAFGGGPISSSAKSRKAVASLLMEPPNGLVDPDGVLEEPPRRAFASVVLPECLKQDIAEELYALFYDSTTLQRNGSLRQVSPGVSTSTSYVKLRMRGSGFRFVVQYTDSDSSVEAFPSVVTMAVACSRSRPGEGPVLLLTIMLDKKTNRIDAKELFQESLTVFTWMMKCLGLKHTTPASFLAALLAFCSPLNDDQQPSIDHQFAIMSPNYYFGQLSGVPLLMEARKLWRWSQPNFDEQGLHAATRHLRRLNRTIARRTCAACGAIAEKQLEPPFKVCGRCFDRSARYCSPECFRVAWKNGHREACEPET